MKPCYLLSCAIGATPFLLGGRLTPAPARSLLIAAKLLGLPLESTLAVVEAEVLLRWLHGHATAPEESAPVLPQPKPRRALPTEDAAFADRVLAAARACKTGRFGEHKVFISHVIGQLAAEGYEVGAVDGFKARLVEAHRSDLLTLSRADLVEAMAPEDVDASETQYRRATFHFVRL
jgi:hypothetical protein